MNQTFFMVYLEGQSAPTYKHQSLESAEVEAKRLCKLHSKKAYILQSIMSISLNEFNVQDYRTPDLPF